MMDRRIELEIHRYGGTNVFEPGEHLFMLSSEGRILYIGVPRRGWTALSQVDLIGDGYRGIVHRIEEAGVDYWSADIFYAELVKAPAGVEEREAYVLAAKVLARELTPAAQPPEDAEEAPEDVTVLVTGEWPGPSPATFPEARHEP